MKRWLKRWAEKGSVEVRKASKAFPLVGERAARRARQLLKEGAYGGLKVVYISLFQEGLTCRALSPSTPSLAVDHLAKRKGIKLKVYRGKPKKALSEA